MELNKDLFLLYIITNINDAVNLFTDVDHFDFYLNF